jgi:Lrp/AsnC family transcriptional regulator, regulator for asnA, asnC and gidA
MTNDLKPLDDLDHAIIAELRLDGRTPNKVLAEKLKVSETTIASRIRVLTENKVMRVMALRDVRALGFDFLAFADIHIQGRAAEDIARELAGIDEVMSITRMLGDPELICQINGRDRHHVLDIVETKIGRVQGILRVSTYLALNVAKYQVDHGDLHSQW